MYLSNILIKFRWNSRRNMNYFSKYNNLQNKINNFGNLNLFSVVKKKSSKY